MHNFPKKWLAVHVTGPTWLRNSHPWFAGLSVLALALTGCDGSTAMQSKQGPPSSSLQTVPPASSSTIEAEISPFAELDTYLAGRVGQVTAAVFDATTNRTWTFNPGIVQDTASIVKVEIMGAALREALDQGQPLPEAEASLMPSMIENSDNASATALLSDIGGPSALASFDQSIGMAHTIPSNLAFIPGTSLPGWGLTTTSALDEVTLISKFAYPNTTLSTNSRDYGLSLMEQVEADQDWGVSAGVPAGTTVALKNGWLSLGSNDWQVNSIGWVDGAGRNYVLAVLTTGSPNEMYGIDTVETVARSMFAKLG